MFAVLFVNTLLPKPQFVFLFKRSQYNRIFGNDYSINALDKKLFGGKLVNRAVLEHLLSTHV